MVLLLFLTFNSLFNLAGSKKYVFCTGMFLGGRIFSPLKFFEKNLGFGQYFKNSSTNEKKTKYLKKFFIVCLILKAFLRTFIRETIPLNLAHWKSDYLLQFTQSSVAIL
jgi:hypothetical protein